MGAAFVSRVKVRWRADAVTAAARAVGMDALERSADRILSAEKAITPLNKKDASHRGTLMRSGDLERDDVAGRVTIRFSVDEPYDYALEQETTDWYSHNAPGQAHFVQAPFDAMKVAERDSVIRTVCDHLRRTP